METVSRLRSMSPSVLPSALVARKVSKYSEKLVAEGLTDSILRQSFFLPLLSMQRGFSVCALSGSAKKADKAIALR